MKYVILLILFACLSCAQINQNSNDEQKQPDFLISSFETHHLKLEYHDNDYHFKYIGIGTIKNNSNSIVDKYEIILNYQSHSDKGAYLLYDKGDLLSKSIINVGNKGFKSRLEPWKPGEEKEFKIDDIILHDDMVYPTNKVEIVYHINASDPLGNSYDEVMGIIDITDQWLKAQSEYVNRSKIKATVIPEEKERDTTQKSLYSIPK